VATRAKSTINRLGLIHTVPSLGDVFASLVGELLPATATTVVVDELMLRDTIQRGQVAEATQSRLRDHVGSLTDSGVDAVLVTCSSLGGVADALNEQADLPVLRVDRAMAERALTIGRRVGVLATLSTTLGPTASLIEQTAQIAGGEVDVVARLCTGAFETLQQGDSDAHDAIVRRELEQLFREVDVVVLAQASTARVLDGLSESPGIPVLSSPRLAVEALAGGVPRRPAGN
jgi:Asp/Glu/hydantoin racemase